MYILLSGSTRRASSSSRGVLQSVRGCVVCVCVCVCVCVSLSVIKCNNSPTHLQWVGWRGQIKKDIYLSFAVLSNGTHTLYSFKKISFSLSLWFVSQFLCGLFCNTISDRRIEVLSGIVLEGVRKITVNRSLFEVSDDIRKGHFLSTSTQRTATCPVCLSLVYNLYCVYLPCITRDLSLCAICNVGTVSFHTVVHTTLY